MDQGGFEFKPIDRLSEGVESAWWSHRTELGQHFLYAVQSRPVLVFEAARQPGYGCMGGAGVGGRRGLEPALSETLRERYQDVSTNFLECLNQWADALSGLGHLLVPREAFQSL